MPDDLDTGSQESNTWYAVYIAETNSDSVITLSTNEVAPVGFSRSRRIGWLRNNADKELFTAQIEKEHLNAAIVQRWIGEGWAKTPGETDAVIDELFAANFELSSPPLSYQGAEAFKEHVRLVKAAFPDIRFTVDEIIAEGDKVAVRWTLRGTHMGEWRDMAPTGRQVRISGTGIVRIADGKIQEWHEHHDALGLMEQVATSMPDSDAERAGDRAVGETPDAATAHIIAGLRALRRGDNEGAVQHFRRAVEVDPASSVGYFDLGLALLRANRFEEALLA